MPSPTERAAEGPGAVLPPGGPPLAHLLLMAGRALDARLRDELEQRGWPRLSATQSLVFAYLDQAGTAPSELARRLGTTRQSAAELVAGISGLGLVEVVANPARPRGRLVRLTGDGHKLAVDALKMLTQLEAELGEIGRRLRRDLGALASGDRGVED